MLMSFVPHAYLSSRILISCPTFSSLVFGVSRRKMQKAELIAPLRFCIISFYTPSASYIDQKKHRIAQKKRMMLANTPLLSIS